LLLLFLDDLAVVLDFLDDLAVVLDLSEKLFLGQLPFIIKIQSMLFSWSNRTSADKTYTISVVLCHALSNFYNYR
jgi:hypothetical protein